ncbi:MAG TPA: hypothetical protein VN687_10775 [Blastocatellia bacterium]|nr:hypothetical protein [Blastocatellia bacterium]
MPSFAPRIRVEVYLPVRYESAYQDTLAWIIRQFTELRGGCTVIENAGGYYLSQYSELIDDRVSVVYCDFPMNWTKRAERNEVLEYCSELQSFMLRNLWEEAVLIAAYPTAHAAV